MGKGGFTILEVFVATCLIALVMVGLANIFLAGKNLILHSREKAAAAELAKFLLEPLYFEVNQTNWNEVSLDYNVGNLQKGSRSGSIISIPFGATFSTYFDVSEVPPGGLDQMRKVVLDITWNPR